MTRPPQDIVQIDGIHGTFVAYRDDLITQQIADYGAHTRNEIAMLLHHVRKGDVCVDLGAHIGTFAVAMAKAVGPTGRVLAVEGSPDTFDLLRTNVRVNQLEDRIVTDVAIIGDGQPRALARLEMSGNSGAGYYSPDASAEMLATVAPSDLLATHGFTMPDIIKMDIEGMEAIALRSLAKIIEVAKPILYLEIAIDQLHRHGDTPQMIETMLRGWDYRFFRNSGLRNSDNDSFTITELDTLTRKDRLFDLLAIPQSRMDKENGKLHGNPADTSTCTGGA